MDQHHTCRPVALREVTRRDRDQVAELFEQLSPISRFMRFHAATPRYSKRLLDFLVDVDGTHHIAWMALDDNRCVGVARFIRLGDDPTAAEVAVTVADSHQGRGLGRILMEAVTASAARLGIERLQWLVHPENRRAIGLMRSLGVDFHFEHGTLVGWQAVTDTTAAAAA